MLKNLFGLFQTTTPVKEVKPVKANKRETAKPDATTKLCTKCHKTLPLDSFNRCVVGALGRQPHCRDCQKEYNQTRRNKTRAKEKQRERYGNTHTLSVHYISAKDFAAFQELKARKKMTTQQLLEEALQSLFILNK